MLRIMSLIYVAIAVTHVFDTLGLLYKKSSSTMTGTIINLACNFYRVNPIRKIKRMEIVSHWFEILARGNYLRTVFIKIILISTSFIN
jgi:hypothetical protein